MTEYSRTANSDPNGLAQGNLHSLLDLLLDDGLGLESPLPFVL